MQKRRELWANNLLTKPQIEMNKADREKAKATARQLLNTLKTEKMVLDWRKRQQARAMVQGAALMLTPES